MLTFPHSRLTNYPAIANPKLPAEGSAAFSNLQLALSILLFPRVLQALLPWIFRLSNSWSWYFFLVALFGVPVAVGYWTLMSYIGPRVNEKCILPGKGLDGYVTIKDVALKQKYPFKMPMQVFHDAYFEGKIDFKGDVLEMMEYRHDWATFNFTPEVSPRLHLRATDTDSTHSSSDTSLSTLSLKSSCTPPAKTKSKSETTTTGETTFTSGSWDPE
jgi:hypothetical protein